MTEKPFEGVLGNTVHLRLIEYLLALPKLDFTVTELARKAKVSRQSSNDALKDFFQWKLVQKLPRRGNMNFYAINLDSPIVAALYNFNEAITGEMYPALKPQLLVGRSYEPQSAGPSELDSASNRALFDVTPAVDLNVPPTIPQTRPQDHREPWQAA